MSIFVTKEKWFKEMISQFNKYLLNAYHMPGAEDSLTV